MKEQNNTTNGGFSQAYKKVPAGALGLVRGRIMAECEWTSTATFYAKKTGKSNIKAPEWRVLVTIFAEYGINAFTGEYTKELQS